MSTATIITASANITPILWRMRPDLKAVSLEFDGRPAWGIKDPVNLEYFELSDEAYFVLKHLDGKSTIAEVCRTFHERYRPRTLSPDDFRGFLGQLVSQNLLVSEGFGHGRLLLLKQRSTKTRLRWSKLSGILAIRFRGFDPDQILSRMLPWVGWLFTPASIAVGLGLISIALVLVIVRFDELIARLPEAQTLLSVSNVVSIGFLLAVVKVVHEFGHGLSCKRFGGECHEMGVMLLVFTPTLYCNVTDVWMLNNKWQRMAVGFAGMWVEASIAAVCTLLWWFSSPGLFHSICLNLMCLCGVSTFLFNGNPLLRYDGYFVLSDWLEIPNLQQQATITLRESICRWFCGIDLRSNSELSLKHRSILLGYGIAAAFYRVLLTFLILWGLYRWLNPLGLGIFVQAFAGLTVGTILFVPLSQATRFLRNPANRTEIQWPQFWWRTGIALTALFLLLLIPIPYHVTAGVIADDGDLERVYVTYPGTLAEAVRLGQSVERGQVLARLEEPRLNVALSQLEGELTQQKLRVEQLERRRVSEPTVGQLIPTLRETVHDLEQQLAQRKINTERLTIRSPRTGITVAPTLHRIPTKSGELVGWTGSPLDERNQGCFLRAGTTLCAIGDDHCRGALVLISQDDIGLVDVGQSVRLLWNELSGEIQTGQIIELAGIDLDALPRELVLRLNLPARITSRGVIRPIGKWYQARIKLDETTIPLIHGAAGTAKILVERQSIYQRTVRWLKRTFLPFS